MGGAFREGKKGTNFFWCSAGRKVSCKGSDGGVNTPARLLHEELCCFKDVLEERELDKQIYVCIALGVNTALSPAIPFLVWNCPD